MQHQSVARQIECGENGPIVGPSRSGKSTLLNSIDDFIYYHLSLISLAIISIIFQFENCHAQAIRRRIFHQPLVSKLRYCVLL